MAAPRDADGGGGGADREEAAPAPAPAQALAQARAVVARELDAGLRCPCCGGLVESPVVVAGCGHSGCSACVRAWLLGARCCPVCRVKADMTDLAPSRALGALAAAYRRVWAELGGAGDPADAPPGEAPPAAKRARVAGEAAADGAAAASTQARRLPWRAYNATSDEQLDADLREYGLPTQGAREAKVELHRAFLLAYNAAVDGGQAPELPDIRRRVLGERAARSSAKLFASAASGAAVPGGAPGAPAAAQQPAGADPTVARAQAAYRRREKSKWTWARVPSDWRAVYSDVLDRPVYFNASTNECTTVPPHHLSQEDVDLARAEARVVAVPASRAPRSGDVVEL